jgi:hypothetical protein
MPELVTYIGVYKDPSTIGDLYEVVVERTPCDSDGRAVGKTTAYHLNPRTDLVNHSPTGVCWGYCGSGPAQCALGILADYLGDDQRALALYQDFKFAVISNFSMDSGWFLTDREIENAITKITVERMKRL